jgi:predicted DCC family thiol-disulfide oxidoreductase YuxK
MSYHGPTRSERPPGRATLIYDASCPFCTACGRWWERHARGPVAVLSFDQTEGSGMLTALTPHERGAMAHLVTADGIEYHGGESVTHALAYVPGGFAAGILDVPPLNFAREAGYQVVTWARPVLSWVVGRVTE